MTEPHAVLNGLSREEAALALDRCCHSRRWVAGMLALRPFASKDALLAAADAVWQGLGRADFLEAFSGHPRIGEDVAALEARFGNTSAWARSEQGGVAVADRSTLEALRDANVAYAERFGYIFIVCATGKSASEMLTLLRARLHAEPEAELLTAAAEQAKITKIRLEKLEGPGP